MRGGNLPPIGERVQDVTGQLDSTSGRWSPSSKSFLVVTAVLLPVLFAGVSLLSRPGYALTSFGDLTEFSLVATATLFFARKGVATRGTPRAFWLLMALGFAMWSVNMFLWIYYEVWLNQPVPSIPIGEFLLFIKLVPMLAALALEPSNDNPDRPRLLGFLDLTSLLVCWTYVYLFWAMAYLLIGPDLAHYNSNSDIVDEVGNQLFLIILAVVAYRSRGSWRGFYLNFLGASAVYSLASILINRALSVGRYYTGSVYDVPLVISLAWFCVISIAYSVDLRSEQPGTAILPKRERPPNRRTVLWSARLSMLATLSTPVIGLWLVMNGKTQDAVGHFRIVLTLFTMLLLTILLLLKQDLLNFKLAGYLQDASLAYSNLRRFQDQLVQSEKLASLGNLVARVAHEINRAMTAVSRDVEMLSSPPKTDGNRQRMTTKIAESARRTNSLVENMLSFAQELPLHRSSVNVRPLIESAVSLTRAGRRHNVRVDIQEHGAVPMVEGDANQLVQVFLHLIANAIDAMEGSKEGLLIIAIRSEQQQIEIGFVDTGSGLKDPRRVFEPFYTTKSVGKGVGLGLSICYGIMRQHGGEIHCSNRPEGGAIFRLVLPAAVTATLEMVT